MDYRRLGGSGLRVPALSFGTAVVGGGDEFCKASGSTDAGGAVGRAPTAGRVAALDPASAVPAAYKVWHQRDFLTLNEWG